VRACASQVAQASACLRNFALRANKWNGIAPLTRSRIAHLSRELIKLEKQRPLSQRPITAIKVTAELSVMSTDKCRAFCQSPTSVTCLKTLMPPFPIAASLAHSHRQPPRASALELAKDRLLRYSVTHHSRTIVSYLSMRKVTATPPLHLSRCRPTLDWLWSAFIGGE